MIAERLILSLIIGGLAVLAFQLLSGYQRRRASAQAEAHGAAGQPQLLYFRGQGCPTCAAQARYLAALEPQLQLLITTIDAEQDTATTQLYNVLTLPTTIIVDRNGQVRHINYGLVNATKLQQQLAEAAA